MHAKSFQSYPTLCDSIDYSLTGKNTGVGCHALLQGNLPNPGGQTQVAYVSWTLPLVPPGKPKLNMYWPKYKA